MTSVMPKYFCALDSSVDVPKFLSMALLSHRQGWSVMAILAFLPCLLFAGSPGDNPPIRYRTGTAEVRVSFFGTDQNGRLLGSLTKDDFAVVDSGTVVRDFRSLVRSDETAVDLVALVDTSGSVTRHFRPNMQQVVQLLESESTTPGDSVSLVEFAGLHPSLICSGDCRSAAAQKQLRGVNAEGATPLYDALTYTAQFVTRRRTPGARQVVILFSDGNDTISRASAREAFEAILDTGALLYTVNLDASGADSTGSALLQRFAEATGGRTFSAHEGIAHVLQAILADLHAAYVVTYSLPTHEAGFHSLRILPKHNLNLRFHCRRGYYYDDEDR